MKKIKKVMILLLVLIPLVGCSKTEKREVEEKKTAFTEDITNYKGTISYKLPVDHETNYSFQDQGASIIFSIDQLEKENTKLNEYDKYTSKIEEKTINEKKYEYYKIKYDKEWIIYIYRTPSDENSYYLFKFNVYAESYDDSQIEKFMNTVNYLN